MDRTVKANQLRRLVEETRAALERAREWHAQEKTRASRENLGEARSEHTLAVRALEKFESDFRDPRQISR